jgi:tRNA dimethylallyltransferase
LTVFAVVGPTASGKSALALRLAEATGGEIVSADSRQVYRGMDIGTAKPTSEERRRARHHMIDIADPTERYDAARYQREARAVLDDLATRHVVAVVVGGTGLYVSALLDGLELAAMPSDRDVRARLEREAALEGPEALHSRLRTLDPVAAAKADARNVRRVIRYLEVALVAGPPSQLWRRGDPIPARKIGLRPPQDVVATRIAERVRLMVRQGVLEETARLLERGVDLTLPSMSGHGYPHWARHLRGEIDLANAIDRTIRDTVAYSRRQMTWFRKDPGIRWCDPTATDALSTVLEAA